MSIHEHDPDIVLCRDCQTTFDLALQHYYDSLCPKCKADANTTTCDICQDTVGADDVQQATFVGRMPTQQVTVCSDECATEAETPPWAPR